ncbi:hypothetical protein K439DRAFT_6208 [Ramaria rubella]|nr:hypothetical protein K439DRAFT_6208 [Ramaria rubella]
MDWRSGSRENATSSAFRGISTRGRGRARGRGTPSNRGDVVSVHAVSSSIMPISSVAVAPSPPPGATTPTLAVDPAKSSSRRGSHQLPRRAPSLNHINAPKAAVASPPERTSTPHGRPQVTRRASHNTISVPVPPIPSLKLDPSTPITPGSPRPKPTRKRSHNRTRSSSKASITPGQLSATPSVSSLKEKSKETPPHMAALASAPPDVQSFDLRTNIDTLVERVRAMAMAGSVVDKEKDKEGRYIPHEGHIDWAGDEDDTLPDLDDWVRPKSAEPKETEKTEPDQTSERPALSPVEEVVRSGFTTHEMQKQHKSALEGSTETIPPRGDTQEEEHKTTHEVEKEKDVASVKAKSRGKHGRKKSSTSDVSIPVPLTTAETMAGSNHRVPLVHPLPPKPQVSATPIRGFRSRGQAQPIHRVDIRGGDDATSTGPAETEATEAQTKKRAFDPSVDWANAPRLLKTPPMVPMPGSIETSDAPSAAAEDHRLVQTKKRAFDPSVDWANAPRSQHPSPTRSPSRSTNSPSSSSNTVIPHPPHTAPPLGRSRGLFPSHTTSPRLSPARPTSGHTRSQVSSPERNPHRVQGTRTNTSRPVITVDALSRISRTLGVTGATTPPRGQTVEVIITD